MARQETVLQVFAASPSDLAEERRVLEVVISEWNLTWAKHLGVRLELLKWETHARPGVGPDAQSVINEQIGDEYDIFVGMMWTRFGTPTLHAGSGTAEEFARAKRRHDEKANVKLLIYFKDAPVPPSQIDPAQLAKVKVFRESLGPEGVLHWQFTSGDQFSQFARMHLAKEVQDWLAKSAVPSLPSMNAGPEGQLPSAKEERDAQQRELVEQKATFIEKSEETTKAIALVAGTHTEFTAKFLARKEEIESVTYAQPFDLDRAQAVLAATAADMDQYAERLEKQLPEFRESQDQALSALSKVTTISLALNETMDVPRTASLKKAVSESKELLLQLIEVVAKTPSVTSEAISARNRVAASLQAYADVMARSERTLSEVLSLLGGCDSLTGGA